MSETEATDPKVLLGHHLKKLKLPTILAEYDKQARQCAEQGIDHPRYLLRLVELELIERQRKNVERRIRAAKFRLQGAARSQQGARPGTGALRVRGTA